MKRAASNADVIRMESTLDDRDTRFALNWARHQYSMETARTVATLLRAGHTVTVGPIGRGWVVDYKWTEDIKSVCV